MEGVLLCHFIAWSSSPSLPFCFLIFHLPFPHPTANYAPPFSSSTSGRIFFLLSFSFVCLFFCYTDEFQGLNSVYLFYISLPPLSFFTLALSLFLCHPWSHSSQSSSLNSPHFPSFPILTSSVSPLNSFPLITPLYFPPFNPLREVKVSCVPPRRSCQRRRRPKLEITNSWGSRERTAEDPAFTKP